MYTANSQAFRVMASAIYSASLSPCDTISSELVLLGCDEAREKMQLVADLLLLQRNIPPYYCIPDHGNKTHATQPASEFRGQPRDAIIANSKRLAISIKDLTHLLEQKDFCGVDRVLCSIASQVVILTESAAHAAYLTSTADIRCKCAKFGVVDRYRFECARQTIHMCYEKFQPRYKLFHSKLQMLNISRLLADNIEVLTCGCKQASENNSVSQSDSAQFINCSQCLQGVAALFLEGLKTLVSSQSEENCKQCLLFGKPLLATVDMVVDFAKYPRFSGTPAVLTQHGFELQTEIVGGAMAVVSSTVQLIGASKYVILEDTTSAKSWQKFANCSKAVAEATKLLSSTVQ